MADPQKIDLHGYQTQQVNAAGQGAPKEPGLIETANAYYNAPPQPGEGTIARIGRSLGRTAMMPVNLAAAAVTPANEEEKKQGFGGAAQFGPLQAHRLVTAPSEQAAEDVDRTALSTAAKGGHPSTAAIYGGHALASLPMIGPWALSTGKRAAQGDVAGALTDTAAMGVLPKVIGEAMPGGALPGAAEAGQSAFPAMKGVGSALVREGASMAERVTPRRLSEGVGAGVGSLVGGHTELPIVGRVGGAGTGGVVGNRLAPILFEEPDKPVVNLPKLRVMGSTKLITPEEFDHLQSFIGPEQSIADYAKSEPQVKVVLPGGKSVALADYARTVKPASGVTPEEMVQQKLADPKTQIENQLGNMSQILREGNHPARTAAGQSPVMEQPSLPLIMGEQIGAESSKMRPVGGATAAPETPAMEDAHPIKVVHDEGGNLVDADGRHRIMQAIERGDKTISVQITAPDGSIRVNQFDPRMVAERIGVTKESLASTDEQQPYRAGNLQPREPVKITRPQVEQAVDDAMGVKPQKPGVAMKDQYKGGSGADDMISKPKESSSRSETQAFIDHGLSKAEGSRLTKVLDQIENASFGEFASRHGVDMGQNTVSRGSMNRGLSMNRGAIVKDMLTRMSPSEIEAAVSAYLKNKK